MVRVKSRYLLVNILYPSSPKSTQPNPPFLLTLHAPTPSLTSYDLLRLIRHKVVDLYGTYGSGALSSSLQIKYFSPATSTFILRVSRKDYRIVWGALTFLNEVGEGKEKCVFRVVRVSGAIKRVEVEAIRRGRELVLRGRREVEGKGGDRDGGRDGRVEGGKGRREEEERSLGVVDESDSGDDEFDDDEC